MALAILYYGFSWINFGPYGTHLDPQTSGTQHFTPFYIEMNNSVKYMLYSHILAQVVTQNLQYFSLNSQLSL